MDEWRGEVNGWMDPAAQGHDAGQLPLLPVDSDALSPGLIRRLEEAADRLVKLRSDAPRPRWGGKYVPRGMVSPQIAGCVVGQLRGSVGGVRDSG